MSFRPASLDDREPPLADQRLERLLATQQPKPVALLSSFTQPAQQVAATISASLGVAPAPPSEPAHPYVSFQPEYGAPAHNPDVVGSLFGDIDVYDTEGLLSNAKAKAKAGLAKAKAGGKSALAKAKQATDKLTLENAKGALSKAKQKAGAAKAAAAGALQKAKSGVGTAMRKLAEATADIANFDYQIESGDSMVIGAIKKKGAEVKPKHQLLPFPIGSWAGHPFWNITQDQQKRMFKANTQTKVSKKGGESVSKDIEKLVREPHVLCMGFFDPNSRTESEQEEPSDTVDAALKKLIFDPSATAADVPTLADTRAIFLPTLELGAADVVKPEKLPKDKRKAYEEATGKAHAEAKEVYQSGGGDWACASGVLVELAEADGLHTDDKGNVPYAFEAVAEEPSIEAFDGAFDPDNINDVFGVTVRGIHVTRDKEIVLGPKIYLPAKRDDMNNLAMYACAEDDVGMVRAVNKASKAEGIDMRMLWAAMQFGRGLADLYAGKLTAASTKAQLKSVFGGLNLQLKENSIRLGFEEDLIGAPVSGFAAMDDDDDEAWAPTLRDAVF